jgi:hypothetical protein
MSISPWVTLLIALHLVASTAMAGNERVWIFTGIPGDQEHHADFEKTLGSLKSAFTTQLGVPPTNLAIYYGPKDAGYAGEATRDNVVAAIKAAASISKKSPETPQWFIFIGHAHKIRGGAQINLPGPDLNSIELAALLADFNPASPITLVFTHTASAPFLRPLAAPGRVVITATAPGGIENETEFPAALAETLADPTSNVNNDSRLDAAEILIATKERVLKVYQSENLIVREAALLDGDGDGRGTQRPAEADATTAAKYFFNLTSSGKGLE